MADRAAPVGPPQLRPGQNVTKHRYDMEARLVQIGGDQFGIVLHVEHGAGATILMLDIEPAEQLGKQLQQLARQSRGESAEGLVIAHTLPLKPH